jgi:hypothetical protein
LFSIAGVFDRFLRNPFVKLLNLMSRKGFRGWETVHKTGPQEAESDEMLFVYAMLSPLLGMLFPFLDKIHEAQFPDTLPAAHRDKLMKYYKDCLKRHLYATGPDKILLEKAALIAGRLQSIAEVLPDMRIIHLVRHPYQSVPSLISMFYIPLKSLAPQVKGDSRAIMEITRMIFAYYQSLLSFKRNFPKEQFYEVRYEELVADPRGTIERIYEKFQLDMSKEFETALNQETEKARLYKSSHTYMFEEYGLTKEQIYRELKDVFEEYGFEY